eukprot:2515514-Amphidinium_carterae.1
MNRHKGLCSGLCEHVGCEMRDKPEHRLYSCVSTHHHREDVKWAQHEDQVTSEQGHCCRRFGIWKLPNPSCLSSHLGVLGMFSEDTVSWYLSRLGNLTKDSSLVVQFWVKVTGWSPPMGAYAWTHIRLSCG